MEQHIKLLSRLVCHAQLICIVACLILLHHLQICSALITGWTWMKHYLTDKQCRTQTLKTYRLIYCIILMERARRYTISHWKCLHSILFGNFVNNVAIATSWCPNDLTQNRNGLEPFTGPLPALSKELFCLTVLSTFGRPFDYTCSAVAEMGDRLATTDMDRKWGLCPFGVGELSPHLTQCLLEYLDRALPP